MDARRTLLASSVVALASASIAEACSDYGQQDEPAPTDGGTTTALDGAPLGPKCPGPGVSCVPAAPAGWDGPFQVYDGNPANAPACPSALPAVAIDGHRDLKDAGDHQCAACTCSKAQGVQCTGVIVQRFSALGCSLAGSVTSSVVQAQCVDTTDGGTSSYQVVGLADGGSCVPSDASVTFRPESAFGFTTRACGANLVSEGCPAATVCAPDPAPPFNAKLCITQRGDVTCPGSPYTQRSTTFARVADTRDCSPCTCGSPTGSICKGSYAVDSLSDCTGKNAEIAFPLGCNDDTYPYAGAKFVAGQCDGGSCPPSGGAAVGKVDLADSVTICCAEN